MRQPSTIDLVPVGVGVDGVPVYATERIAGAVNACQLLLNHPRETLRVLALAAVVIACCWLLTERHAAAFARNAQLKHEVAKLLRRLLPPERSGRPGLLMVTAAIREHDRLKRIHPKWPIKRVGITCIRA